MIALKVEAIKASAGIKLDAMRGRDIRSLDKLFGATMMKSSRDRSALRHDPRDLAGRGIGSARFPPSGPRDLEPIRETWHRSARPATPRPRGSAGRSARPAVVLRCSLIRAGRIPFGRGNTPPAGANPDEGAWQRPLARTTGSTVKFDPTTGSRVNSRHNAMLSDLQSWHGQRAIARQPMHPGNRCRGPARGSLGWLCRL
jgi:hypothetical protein